MSRISSLNDEISSLNNKVNDLSDHVSFVKLTRLASGRQSMDIDADLIRFPHQQIHQLTEIFKDGQRVWSEPYYAVNVGDSVTWNWNTIENIVSADSSYKILDGSSRLIYSGKLDTKIPGSFTFKFEIPGTYYYASENSQSMRGFIKVNEMPYVLPVQSILGPIHPIPSGPQKSLNRTYLEKELQGCWVVCHNQPISYATSSIPTMLGECGSDWIFFGSYLKTNPSDILLGAFAKADIFERSDDSSNQNYYSSVISVPAVFENGVYWYYYHNANYNWFTYGFSSRNNPSLNRNYVYTECNNNGYQVPDCSSILSFGYAQGCASCHYSSSSDMYRIVYKNTCEVASPS